MRGSTFKKNGLIAVIQHWIHLPAGSKPNAACLRIGAVQTNDIILVIQIKISLYIRFSQWLGDFFYPTCQHAKIRVWNQTKPTQPTTATKPNPHFTKAFPSLLSLLLIITPNHWVLCVTSLYHLYLVLKGSNDEPTSEIPQVTVTFKNERPKRKEEPAHTHTYVATDLQEVIPNTELFPVLNNSSTRHLFTINFFK